jgi:flagellar hook-associated protein 3 FlgL
MITNLSPQAHSFLAEMDRVQQMVSDASRQVSSGLRVSQASDDPDVISRLLQLRAALQKNTQITTNLGQAQTDANVSESALSSAAQLMDQAVSLASQGATATTDATGRQTLANQVQAILDQMVAYSRTQSAGRYVFSGDDATSPSYQVDLSQPNGVDQLIVTAATRLVENPAGGSFAVSETAQTIFDARNADGTLASGNIFAALTSLYNGLIKNDTAAITNSIGSLQQASDHLNICLAFYGDVQTRIQDATNFAGNYNVQLRTQISQEQDADIAAASLELSQGTTQIQAAFEMQAKIPKTTLFDFLNG